MENVREKRKKRGALTEFERAREAALMLLDHQDRTRAEMVDRLMKKGFSEEVATEVADALVEAGLIDDRRYAELFAESKLEAGRGIRWIQTRLRQKGIPSDILGEVLEQLRDTADEEELCLRTALSMAGLQQDYYVETDGELAPYDDSCGQLNYFSAHISEDETDRRVIYKEKEKARSRLARKLVSRGYSPGAAFSAVNKIDAL